MASLPAIQFFVATLLEFARMNDAAAATSRKLEKQRIFADYIRALAESDLRLATRFAAGRAFAATDERTLNVGGAIVWDVTLALLGIDPRAYHDLVVQSGEIGEAIAKLWDTAVQNMSAAPGRDRCRLMSGLLAVHAACEVPTSSEASSAGAGSLTLQDLASAFDRLNATGVVERKRELLHALLARCGTGREAAYVTKIIFGDLRTGVQEGVLQGAIAEAFDQPIEKVRRCQFLVGDLEEVAVLARRGQLDSARFTLFHPIQFMLASPRDSAKLAADALAGRTFWAEDKLDGIRAQIHKSADRIAIYTRTMDRTDESFPEVVAAVAKMPGEFLLDGEIVPYRDGCVLPFASIQKRLGRKAPSARMLRENPAAFIAFDLLYLNGELLMDQPLRARRAKLLALCAGDVGVRTIAATEVADAGQIGAAFDAARARRNEGIVLKDPESSYSPGRRGLFWFKLKTHLPTFDCVVTAAEYGHGKRRSVLSDYTFAVWTDDPANPDARLVNVGKAYSGLTDEEIATLTETFLRLSRQQIGRVHIVEPRIVLEIACDQIQKSARHASGYALRFPRIKRIRSDKNPQDADRLPRIVEIYESLHNFAKGIQPLAEPAPEPTLFD